MTNGGRIDEKNLWKYLKSLILRNTGRAGLAPTPPPEVAFHRHRGAEAPARHFMSPVLIVVPQGDKYVRIGKSERRYPEGCFFISALDMPVTSRAIEASRDSPYLSLSVELDMDLTAALAAKTRSRSRSDSAPSLGATGGELDPASLDAAVRLAELAETPEDIPCLKAGLLSELRYRLLKSEAGELLRGICSLNFPLSKARDIIARIKENYNNSFVVADIAAKLGLAPSTLRKYFKAATSLSPIQYQKRLRLSEARRMLANGSAKVGEVAERTGYERSSHFSREFSRFYGFPPRDASR